MKEKIKELMTHMPNTIGADISLEKAKEKMREHHCHHLPVLDGGQLVGVISEKDIEFATALKLNTDDIPVQEIMSEEPVIVNPDDELKKVLELMLQEKINSVIVQASEGESWGIFTTTDLIKHYIKE